MSRLGNMFCRCGRLVEMSYSCLLSVRSPGGNWRIVDLEGSADRADFRGKVAVTPNQTSGMEVPADIQSWDQSAIGGRGGGTL